MSLAKKAAAQFIKKAADTWSPSSGAVAQLRGKPGAAAKKIMAKTKLTPEKAKSNMAGLMKKLNLTTKVPKL